MREVLRIGSIIIFRVSELWNANFSIWCGVILLVSLEEKFEMITLGSERVNTPQRLL